MKLISVTVGLPRDIIWRGKAVKSSIWKNPVAGRVRAYEKLQQGIWSHNGIFHLVDSWPRTGFVPHGFQVLASVHKPLRVRDLWKELGFTRSSTHTVWPSEVSAS